MGEILIDEELLDVYDPVNGDATVAIDISQADGFGYSFARVTTTAPGEDKIRPQVALDPGLTIWVDIYDKSGVVLELPFNFGLSLYFRVIGHGLRLRAFGGSSNSGIKVSLWRQGREQ